VLSEEVDDVCEDVVAGLAAVVGACVTTTLRTSSVLEEQALPASERRIRKAAPFVRDDVFMRPPKSSG
jgi:hypothetical protein